MAFVKDIEEMIVKFLESPQIGKALEKNKRGISKFSNLKVHYKK